MPDTKIWTGDASTTVYATDGNWYNDGPAPVATDNVIIAFGASQNIAGADHDGYELTSFLVELGMPKTIGSHATPLLIDAVTVNLAGTGAQFYGLNDATIVNVNQAATSSTETGYGLNLTGAANDAIVVRPVNPGTVSIGWQGVTGAYADVLLERGKLLMDTGATTSTLKATGGTLISNVAIATVTLQGNSKTQWDIGAITTLTGREQARININSTGAITTINAYDNCVIDFDGGGNQTIAVANLNIYGKNVRIIDTNKRVDWTASQVTDYANYFGLGFGAVLTIV